jgi:hypothetical protein
MTAEGVGTPTIFGVIGSTEVRSHLGAQGNSTSLLERRAASCSPANSNGHRGSASGRQMGWFEQMRNGGVNGGYFSTAFRRRAT